MTQKAITIKDLAEKLNISVSTVSRALKDNPEISQQTRAGPGQRTGLQTQSHSSGFKDSQK